MNHAHHASHAIDHDHSTHDHASHDPTSVAQSTSILRRLKILEGQMRGLQELVKQDAYCVDIITQTSAVKQGISNVEDLLLDRHLSSCVIKQIEEGQTDKAKAEILKVYKLKRK